MIYLVAFDLDGTLSQSDRFLPRPTAWRPKSWGRRSPRRRRCAI